MTPAVCQEVPDDPEIELRRSEVREQLQQLESRQQCEKLLDQMPLSLLSRADSDYLAKQIELVACNIADGALCTSGYDPRFNAIRYTVVRREDEHSIGTFARATGVLSTSGLTILRAQIEMVGDLAWDNYWVADPEGPDRQPGDSRTDSICASECVTCWIHPMSHSLRIGKSGIHTILAREIV